ncbi:MAG: hypothetical protein QOI31_1581 [Solirubrobacterales bacterium]|jgi:hypothetical protein|nr:hypothetical protein [Solirubrobacterales bacterium]
MRRGVTLALLAALAAAGIAALPAGASTTYGDIEFPRDEHGHVDGWDFWWGAADLTTKSGNQYTVGIAFDALHGVGVTGHQIYPEQGPYEGRSIMTQDGPKEWGHEGNWAGRIVAIPSFNNPLFETPPVYQTLDAGAGFKDVGHWERTSLESEDYHLRLDHDTAWVHPTGEHVKAVVDLKPKMDSPPLLAGGTGNWWYGIPGFFDYESRSYQYMQAAKSLTGTLSIEQPDGSMLEEKVAPRKSRMLMVREYDASPEDLYAGLALAEGTQLSPTYAQYYHAGMPWELIFMDLDNDAQLMLSVLAFHETDEGTIAPLVGDEQPTYAALTTLRLPNGKSVAIPEEDLTIQHLNYKTIIGRVPTFWVALTGIWRQSWDYRVTYDGGRVEGPNGKMVKVPPFDLGLEPEWDIREPAVNAEGDGPTQRIPYEATGSYDGCPIDGFGFSELIINWYGYEDADPWYTGGNLPGIPKRCGAKPGKERDPNRGDPSIGGPPSNNPATAESCTAFNPGTPACEYIATSDGGIGGVAAAPGGWKVTITRPGVAEPIVIPSLGGFQTYQCGTITPGDTVLLEAEPSAGVMVGNPGFCIESTGE